MYYKRKLAGLITLWFAEQNKRMICSNRTDDLLSVPASQRVEGTEAVNEDSGRVFAQKVIKLEEM